MDDSRRDRDQQTEAEDEVCRQGTAGQPSALAALYDRHAESDESKRAENADAVEQGRPIGPRTPEEEGAEDQPGEDKRHRARVHPTLGGIALDQLRYAAGDEPALDLTLQRTVDGS